VRPVVGVEHHELDVRQWFARIEQGGVALGAVKDVQRTVGLPGFKHRQAALPRQELPFDFDAQTLEHNGRGFVVEAELLAAVFIHVRRPRLGDNTQLLAPSGEAQASKYQHGEQLCDQRHGWRLRRESRKSQKAAAEALFRCISTSARALDLVFFSTKGERWFWRYRFTMAHIHRLENLGFSANEAEKVGRSCAILNLLISLKICWSGRACVFFKLGFTAFIKICQIVIFKQWSLE
jgi:hypothetical protein